jgi:cytosine/adenosine deaminase-related metal-dependent hydrolase
LTDAPLKLVQAKWLAPMDLPTHRPILRDGGVLIQGNRIVAVDASKTLRGSHPNAEVIDLPRSVLLPGLVNAHVHLELSDCSTGGGTSAPLSSTSESQKPREFPTWLIGMLQRTRITEEDMEHRSPAPSRSEWNNVTASA